MVVSATSLSLEVPSVHGALTGTISADGNTVNSTWTQNGAALALVLTRQAGAIEPPKVAFDPAMPPVDVDKIGAVLDADLAAALASGDLSPATGGGVTLGVVAHGVRRILSYGATKPDAVFEIGSVTKTFTGLILAQMVEQHKVRLDEPVRVLLPAGTVAPPAVGPEITLLDLSARALRGCPTTSTLPIPRTPTPTTTKRRSTRSWRVVGSRFRRNPSLGTATWALACWVRRWPTAPGLRTKRCCASR